MKVIYLNAVITVPTEEAEERIKEATKEDRGSPKIDYHSLGIRPPKDEVERDEYGNIILDEHEVEEVAIPISIPIKNLDSWEAHIEGGSVVSTKSGRVYEVIEEFHEIDSYIEYTTMSWWRKQLLVFKSFFARKQKIQTN
jgi:hypothetical protein